MSLGILLAFYLIPSYIMISGGWPDELMIMKSPRYYNTALNYIWIILITYSIAVVFGLNFLKDKPINEKKISRVDNNSLDIFLLAISYGMIFYSIDIRDVIQAENRFFSEHGRLLNISSVILLYVFCKNLVIDYKKINTNVVLIIAGFGFLIYPIAHSSRAATIPFVIVAIYYFYIRENFTKGLFYVGISTLFLGSSLYTRDNLGFINFLQNIFFLLINPGVIVEKIMYIVPGIGTSSLAMEMMAEKWEFDGGFLNFIAYISPIPSFLLSEKFWELGYSVYLNVTYMGLNTDYISEWIWWFGFWGCIIAGLFTALVTLSPLLLANFIKINRFQLMLMSISSLYFLMAGTSMSLRSSTRFLVYVIAFIVIKNYFFKKGDE